MKKIFTLILLMALAVPAWAAIQWRGGTGELTIDGASYANLIGYNSYNKIVQPLDNLLGGYCTEYLQYNSSTIITVKAGSCAVSNSQGTIRMFMLDSADTNLTTANLDAGVAFAAGTTYYVYATSPNATTQASTYYISLSSTAPTGQTYYKRIGSFYSDASSQITTISNDNSKVLRASTAKTAGVTYQAATDGFLVGTWSGFTTSTDVVSVVSDSSATPTTGLFYFGTSNLAASQVDVRSGFTVPVKAGDYYKASITHGSLTLYWIPLN